MSALQDILNKYRKISTTEREKGDHFEKLMIRFLLSNPEYEGIIDHVWLWKDFPHIGNKKDLGIDLVAETKGGGNFGLFNVSAMLKILQYQKKTLTAFLPLPAVHFLWKDSA